MNFEKNVKNRGETSIEKISPVCNPPGRVAKRCFSLSKRNEFVINRHRYKNLGTLFSRIAKQAGLPEIPRPFDNMRATRSNEIHKCFGPHKESEWIGHSAEVAKDHSLMIQDSDDLEAAQWEIQSTKKEFPDSIPDKEK